MSIKGINTGKKQFNWGSLTIILLTALLFTLLGIFSDTFFTYKNIYAIFYGVSIQFFAIIGFTYLMIMGEIDLSVGSIYAFSGMLVGVLMADKIPMALAILISLAIATLFGVITGLIVVKFKVNSMMVTIGTMTLIRGISSSFVKNLYGATYKSDFRHLSKIKVGHGLTTALNKVFPQVEAGSGIFLTIILFIAIVIVLEVMLHRTSIFKKMYYVGENVDTATIYGIKADRIKVITFAVSSLTAAIGGLLINSRVTYADTSIGMGLEFHVLTAAVLGGASLFGGKGSILRSAIGLIFLATIQNGMIIFNIEPLLQQLIIGVILIVAVFIDTRLNGTNRS